MQTIGGRFVGAERTALSISGQKDMGMPNTTPSRLMFLSTGAAHDTPGAGRAPMPLVVALESLSSAKVQ